MLVGKLFHVDQLLTNVSIGYRNAAYIADLICPMVRVGERSGLVGKLTMSDWFRNSAQPRSSGTRSKGHGFGTDLTDTFYCHRYSFRLEIDDDTRGMAGEPFKLDQLATNFVTDKLQMKREVNFASDFFATGVWGSDKVAGTDFTAWDDFAGGQPAVDMEAWKSSVELKCGMTPTDFTIGRDVWTEVKFSPDLVDQIKYTQRGQLTTELFASLLELRNLHIGRAIYTTAARGTSEASVTYTRIWGKHGLLPYVPSAPALFEPAACYALYWNRPGAPVGIPQYIKRMRDEEHEIDIFESNSYFDQKKTEARAGLFAQNLTS